jgi:two-component system nitrate/nitrite sensor histidine kinase NarX
MQLAKELADLLEAKREQICTTWIDLIERLPAPQVRGRAAPDLYILTTRGLDALLAFLGTGSYVSLESYLTNLYQTDLGVDADVAEAIDALFLFKEATMSVLRQSIPCGSRTMLDACARMDACLRHSVSFLARQHAVATNERLRERQERTETLLEIVRAAASTLELDEVLRRVAAAISAVAGTPDCGFCLVDEERGLLVPHNVDGAERSDAASLIGPRVPALSLARLDAFDRQVLDEQEPAVCANAETDPRVARHWTHPRGIKSMLAVPFVVKGRVVAIAFALTYDAFREFDQEQIDLASGIANAVGLAIENARLHERIKGMAIVEERDRLAREMHDNLAQAVSALQLKASEAAVYLANGQTEKAQINLDVLQDMISEAHTDVRETIFDMRTIVSPVAGFLSALETYLTTYRTRYGVDVDLSVQVEPELDLAGDVGFQVMRIIQEALTNVRKHAGTSRAAIRIEHEDGRVLIRVCDDGRGFDRVRVMNGAGHHLGLQVMCERAESIGGALEIESQPGKGTCVILSVPAASGGDL